MMTFKKPRTARGRSDDADAFFPEPDGNVARAPDDLAEELAEGFLSSATSGEEDVDYHERVVPEEIGGPFVESPGSTEFADGTDESNPADAEVAPFPTTGTLVGSGES